MILSSEISPKYLARRKELMLAFFRRGLKLVSARTAFGDASELDALNQTRAVIFSPNYIIMNKKTIITIFLSAMMLFLMSACSGNDIRDTYWRDNKTGEWLIGLTDDRVIYDSKVWGISKMDERDGTYTIQANYGMNSLDINIAKGIQADRSIITIDWRYRLLVFFWRLVPRWLWVRLKVASK